MNSNNQILAKGKAKGKQDFLRVSSINDITAMRDEELDKLSQRALPPSVRNVVLAEIALRRLLPGLLDGSQVSWRTTA